MLDGHGEDLAMRFENGPGSSRRNVGIPDVVRRGEKVRPHGRKIAGYADSNRMLLAAGWVVNVKGAKFLVDNRVWPHRSRLDVVTVAGNRFADLLRRGVVGEKIHRAVAVGKKIDPMVEPHGGRIVRIFARHFFYGRIGQPCDPDRRSGSTAIVL